MPLPSIRSIGTPVGAIASATQTLVPYPATIVAGDLLVMFLQRNQAAAGTWTLPSGWTSGGEFLSADMVLSIFYKIATGSESGTLTLANSGGSQEGQVIVCFKDVDTANPFRPAFAGGAQSSGATVSMPSLTATGSGLPVLAVAHIAGNTAPGTLTGDPTGETGGDWTNAFNQAYSSVGATNVSCAIATAALNSGDTISGGTATFSGSPTFNSTAVFGLAGVASTGITATLTANEPADTLAANGWPEILATLTANEAAEPLTAQADVGAASITATLTVNEAADTLTADAAPGALAITATLTASEPADTLAATGWLEIRAALTASEPPDTLAASGWLAIVGNLNFSEPPDGIIASAKLARPGNYASPVEGVADLWSIDLRSFNGPILRFCSIADFDTPIFYGGQEYTPIPIGAEGFEWRANGALPQPTLFVSNVFGGMNLLFDQYGELLGAPVTRRRILVDWLDSGSSPDGNAFIGEDSFVIDQKVSHTPAVVGFKLGWKADQEGTQLPRRLVLRDVCTHTYRRWTGAAFDYGIATCPYAGGPMFDVYDVPTTTGANDQCSRKLTGCKLRFPSQPLPTRAFPAVGRVR